MLQVANNASSLLAPPIPTTDNTIATIGNVEAAADQTTTTLVGSLSAIGAAVGGVFIKNNHDNKKSKQSIKNTDEDLCDYIELLDLEDKYTLQNPTKTRAEILMMPAYPGEPAITTSLGEAKAKESKEWKQFIKAKYYTDSS